MLKKFLFAIFLISFLAPMAFSEFDDKYQSWEVKEIKDSKMYVRFRVNVPAVLKYLEARKIKLEAEIKKAPKELLPNLERNLENVNYNIGRMKSGKKLLGIWVFGDFNNWKTAVSEVPNVLEPTKGNPDTWYTKTYTNIKKYKDANKQYRYKFVLNYGVYNDEDGAEKDDFVYVEDPLSGDNVSDDGFGGLNSFFVYKEK